MRYFVLCLDKAQKTVFAIVLAGEAFRECFSSEDRFIAVHSFANSASHSRFSLFPDNLLTEKELMGVPIKYVGTSNDLRALQKELLREGWTFKKSEDDAAMARKIRPTKIGDDSYDYGDVVLKDEFTGLLIRLAARKNILRFR